MTRRLLTALPAAVLAATLAACGGSDDGSPTTTAATTAVGDATTTASVPTTVAPQETTAQSIEPPAKETTMPDPSDAQIIPGTPESFLGTWHDPDGGAVVTFADDGSLTGTDGCNRFVATWKLSSGDGGQGSVVTVAPFATTLMACAGPWSAWIISMASIRHDGDHLTVSNDTGLEIGQLTPAVPVDASDASDNPVPE